MIFTHQLAATGVPLYPGIKMPPAIRPFLSWVCHSEPTKWPGFQEVSRYDCVPLPPQPFPVSISFIIQLNPYQPHKHPHKVWSLQGDLLCCCSGQMFIDYKSPCNLSAKYSEEFNITYQVLLIKGWVNYRFCLIY